MIKKFIIADEFVNSRLDRWFRRKIFDIPQSLLEKSIRKGYIKVNDKKEISSYKLKLNDKINVYELKLIANKHKLKNTPYKPTKNEISYSSSLFIENNDNFAVINKPAGISVQSGTKSKRNILDILKSTKEFLESYPYTVHRIDKETTGVLIVAKNRKYAQLFTSLFRIRKIHKVYLGIALGSVVKKKGTIKDDLFHYEGNKKVITKAITHFNLLDSNNNYSLLRLSPETGRKHQLRKHLLMYGHPILGDKKYRISNKHKSQNSNLMLHAYKINFSIDGVKYNYSAKPPDVFTKFIKEKYLKIYQ
jgi:23S rRNA pseudouridine955/2504/2580 synthase